jgi:hypothetical protein
MMTLHFSNAEELSVAICEHQKPRAAAGVPDSPLERQLAHEQRRLVREALAAFGHAERTRHRKGTLEEALA